MSGCTCPTTGWPDPDCPKHGLRPGQRFPPMDRHKLPGEDARAAQKRLYLESLGKTECFLCGRVGARQFVAEPPEAGRTESRARCRNALSCGRRSRQRESDARTRLRLVANAVTLHRFIYGNEEDLQAAVSGALLKQWAVVREYHLGLDRIDLYVPALRVGVETKVAGDRNAVMRQCFRYLEHRDLDALLLVTNRVRHQLPAELSLKPVSVVCLAQSAL